MSIVTDAEECPSARCTVTTSHPARINPDAYKPITYTVAVGDDTKDQDPLTLQGLGAVIGAVIGMDTLSG